MTKLWVLLGACAIGCQASAGAQASVNTQETAKADGELDAELAQSSKVEERPTKNAVAPTDEQTSAAMAPPALLGARASLHLAKTDTAQCQCLAVAVGQPQDPAFRWDGAMTVIDPSSQIVIALSSEGVACNDPPKGSLGASYYGYERSGEDVVVQVEVGRLGRPIAGGAVIPKPSEGGRILVRPVERNAPYGRSLDGKEPQCVVWAAK